MSSITWLHLSDLHLRADKIKKWDQDIVLRSLLVDVQERIKEDRLAPDFIVVSGDIAFSGVPEEYALASAFFDEMLDATGLGKDRLFVVPGNHDVDRSRITRAAKAIARDLTSRDAVAEVFAEAEDRRVLFRRLDSYANFVNNYLQGNLDFDDEDYFYVRTLFLKEQRVTVLGLNSAWIAEGGEEDDRLLLIGEQQVREAVRLAETADVRLAVMHHPFDWLRGFDQDDCEELLMTQCDFILRGHLHRAKTLQLRNPDATSMVLAAGSVYEDRKSHSNACNWVQFDMASRQGTVYLRTYSDRSGGFWTEDTGTYKNARNGVLTFKLSEPEEVGRAGFVPSSPPPLPVIDGARLETNYLQRMQETCNVLPLSVIDPLAAERIQRWTMELLPVYVSLDTRSMAATDEDGETEKADALTPVLARTIEGAERGERRPLSALEAAERERRLVLLGDPGSGKSTFVKYLALCLAGGRLEQAGPALPVPQDGWMSHLAPVWTRGPLLPLHVTLREFSASKWCDGTAAGLWAFVAEALRSQNLGDLTGHLLAQLVGGNVVVLLDGLDEVAEANKRVAVRDAVLDFARTHGSTNRYLVTCRRYAYQKPCDQLEGFVAHTLAPLSQTQINAFIAGWYKELRRLGVKTQGDASLFTRELQDLTKRRDLAALAGSPLQLTMMASLHSSWGRLPDDRIALYQQMVQLLLVRWEEAHIGKDSVSGADRLAIGELESALEHVAFEAHAEQEGLEGMANIPESTLLGILKRTVAEDYSHAERLKNRIQQRAGLLIEREPGIYTFPHRSYQEYLAGAFLARQPDFPGRAATLARQNYPQWREVLLWAVGVTRKMPHLAVDVVRALCPAGPPRSRTGMARVDEADWRLASLAGEALLETGLKKVDECEWNREVPERVRQWLVAMLVQVKLPPTERAAAGRVLGKLGDPRPEVTGILRTDGGLCLPDLALCYVPEGPFWMGEGHDFHLNERADRPYWIGKYPITNAQFRPFVEDPAGYRNDEWWTDDGLTWRKREARTGPRDLGEPFNLPNHPVVAVAWYEALAYTRWLSARLSAWAGYPVEASLPSEAEWEKAARGGVGVPEKPVVIRLGEDGADALWQWACSPPGLRKNPDEKRLYPWEGEADPNLANYEDTAIGSTSTPGCFPPGMSLYGCEDMSGNVWEWTRSTYADYSYEPEDGWEELAGDSLRVLRGGSFGINVDLARCAVRNGFNPSGDFHDHGVRVVVVVPHVSGL